MANWFRQAVRAPVTFIVQIGCYFEDVARSNASKYGQDGNPIFTAYGEIMKGRGYVKPELAGFLRTPARSFEAVKALRNGL